MIHPARLRDCNAEPLRPERAFVLYWMIAARRLRASYALERAVDHARALRRPLVILEALRCDYRWSSDRLHRFVLDGMADNARRSVRHPVTYYPYVEPRHGAGRGLLAALGRQACVVVTDDFPCFFLPRMVARAAECLDVRLEAVDGNGLLPMRAAPQAYPSAYTFRRFVQRAIPEHLALFPRDEPLRGARLPRLAWLPTAIVRRWPPAGAELLAGKPTALARLPIDHDVPVVTYRGGTTAATRALARFVDQRLPRYLEERNRPEADVTSGLSPYLHFGHLGVHDVFARLAVAEDWHSGLLAQRTAGQREGFWGMGRAAEAFLDELVTWRELGYNFCAHRQDHDRLASLPDWAQRTLAEHASDARQHVYRLADFEAARTHDPLWNAAQRQLLAEGRIQGYLRMLWGKKILEWTRTPQEALRVMIELNNKYGVDGRNPNSYSGIAWVLGRYDRPWAPERPVYGKVRYMSSDNTARKFRVKGYLERHAAADRA